jgi:hypothetical protein
MTLITIMMPLNKCPYPKCESAIVLGIDSLVKAVFV